MLFSAACVPLPLKAANYVLWNQSKQFDSKVLMKMITDNAGNADLSCQKLVCDYIGNIYTNLLIKVATCSEAKNYILFYLKYYFLIDDMSRL